LDEFLSELFKEERRAGSPPVGRRQPK
jgi:hypothetical protein